MVKTCKNNGVNIIVDAVINHMANHGEGKGRCGTVLHSKCNFVGVFGCQDFHHNACAGGKPCMSYAQSVHGLDPWGGANSTNACWEGQYSACIS